MEDKIHLFLDVCAKTGGEGFAYDMVSGGSDEDIARLLGLLCKQYPEFLTAILLAPFRALYELDKIDADSLYYATEAIKEGSSDVVFDLTELIV